MAKRVDKELRQAELRETATAVFAERGYQATTMDEIAQRAGVSKGMLYLYFENKESLFGEVFRWFGRMTEEMVIEAITGIDNEADKIRRITATWAEVAIQYREFVPLFLDFWAAASLRGMRYDYARDLAKMYDEYRTMIIGLIEQGKTSGIFRNDVDAKAVAYLLVGGMDGIFIQSWLSQPDNIDSLMLNATEALLRGICNV
jgi:AcrR family transcriptional regulator